MPRRVQNISLLGVDLAWGDRNPDGLCAIQVRSGRVASMEPGLTHGDDALVDWCLRSSGSKTVLVTLDAPIVIPNRTGSRPVDRLTHVLFGRYKAGCYPANLGKCPRPVRVAEKLSAAGFEIGWNVRGGSQLLSEVYPHPAMVRMFQLEERIPYKKGRVEDKRAWFRILQRHIRKWVKASCPEIPLSGWMSGLLREPWSKAIEDQTDALVCALIGYHHWKHSGTRSEVIGDLETGFILLPADTSLPSAP